MFQCSCAHSQKQQLEESGRGRAVIEKQGLQTENRQEKGRIMEVKIGCGGASFTGWEQMHQFETDQCTQERKI